MTSFFADIPSDVSRSDVTEKHQQLSRLKGYLETILVAEKKEEIEARQQILNDLNFVLIRIKAMDRYIIEKMFVELFSIAQNEVSPKLAGVISRTKKFSVTTALPILLSELLEMLN